MHCARASRTVVVFAKMTCSWRHVDRYPVFWGVILTFVVDATEDVLGVTRLHHVALTGFGGGGSGV